MSEEINTAQNNLCATDEEFEEFQSASMYEEEEFITLSDIVPPKPNTTDLMDELPFDNEDDLDSTADSQQSNEIFQSQSKQEITIATNNDNLPQSNGNSEQKRPKKRGRKKKSLVQSKTSDSCQSIQNSDAVFNAENASHEQGMTTENLTASSGRLTRRRKPKTPYSPQHNTNSKPPRNKSKIQITDQISTESKSHTKRSKRGRPKKNLANTSGLCSGLVSENDSELAFSDSTPFVQTVPPLQVSGYSTNEDASYLLNQSQDSSEYTEIKYESKCETSIDTFPETFNEDVTLATSPRKKLKRGTKKSKAPKQSTESNNPIESKVEESIESDDDICLSDLKTIETTKEDSPMDIPNTFVAPAVETGSFNPSVEQPELSEVLDSTMDFDTIIKSEIIRAESNGHNIIDNNDKNQADDGTSLLIESSKRPVRRKAKKTIVYQQDESDEDPFANVVLSEDESPRKKKGTKYYSDDEYIPGKKSKVESESYSEDSTEMMLEDTKPKRRRLTKTVSKRKSTTELKTNIVTTQSPKVTTIAPTDSADDIEVCLQSSVIKATDSKAGTWGANEFESFLAKKINADLKIKKVSSTDKTDTSKVPLEIPTIDPTQLKKYVESSMQTNPIQQSSATTQTTSSHEWEMKHNISLTKDQSLKACEFLKNVVQTTSELGQLMTEKSEDFIKKKINAENVTDTFKMDYCVKKSYLLFKLAKSNLLQMEEDLATQYDMFLKENNLSEYREKQKQIEPKPKKSNDDSDCEIVDVEPSVSNKNKKHGKISQVPFNPKTVFLNKELSIKIAKKPSEEKDKNIKQNLNIKGRHTVWINDSIMVKKVKPTQSFLAQDSRNKKPPDSLLSYIVSNFFKHYNSVKAAHVCAPFVSLGWVTAQPNYICNYFSVKPDNIPFPHNTDTSSSNLNGNSTTDLDCMEYCTQNTKYSPKTLFSLCTEVMQCHINSRTKLTTKKAFFAEHQRHVVKPKSLFQICIRAINSYSTAIKLENTVKNDEMITLKPVPSLKSITLSNVQELTFNPGHKQNAQSPVRDCTPKKIYTNEEIKDIVIVPHKSKPLGVAKSLLSICINVIQHIMRNNVDFMPLTLKTLSLKKTIQCMYSESESMISKEVTISCESEQFEELRINFVNTLTDDAFTNINAFTIDENSHLSVDNSVSTNGDFDNDEPDYPDFVEETHSQDSWIQDIYNHESKANISKFSMISQSLNSDGTDQICATLKKNCSEQDTAYVTQIKIEPLDEMPPSPKVPTSPKVSEPAIIKTEPGVNQMTIIPEFIVTKQEIQEANVTCAAIGRQNSASFDVETFESFVRCNKMMQSIDYDENDDIFSQSELRVRRQHEPDYDNENDNNLSLLVPHASQPFNVTKDSLMKSSSEDESGKNTTKKKTEKKRGRPKKNTIKEATPQKDKILPSVPVELPLDSEKKKEKVQNNDIAVLTRKMKERIRQEEKTIDSSESESETLPLKVRLDKMNKKKSNFNKKIINKQNESEIQCNNIDSTEKESETIVPLLDDKFSGFSAVDQCEMSTYQKYVNFMYDKIIHKDSTDSQQTQEDNGNASSDPPIINPEDPVEYLECHPTMPIMDEDNEKVKIKPGPKNKKKVIKDKKEDTKPQDPEEDKTIKEVITPIPTERDGWSCYPINGNDSKLYADAYISLEKLPETFIETYFQFQDIPSRNNDDVEIDKLTNLQSLSRIPSLKEKSKVESKLKKNDSKNSSRAVSPTFSDQETELKPSEDEEEKRQDNDIQTVKIKIESQNENSSRTVSPTFSDHQAELTPSEDEGDKDKDDNSAFLPAPHTEISMAKNSLMDDRETDSEGELKENVTKKIKKELINDDPDEEPVFRRRPGPKSKTRPQPSHENAENLMLTADKVMQRDLALLHAPVTQLDPPIPESPKKDVNRPKTRHSTRSSKVKAETVNEDDSSSEEEKQWVSTKEKLLKRVAKKPEDTTVEDAKRAKLVSEFIERRGDKADSHKRARMPRMPRSRKKMLERQKQLNILSRELYGESGTDPAHPGKRSAAYFKGRRNIRKVIDKKSLAESTVRANMKEFDRKRRLNMKLHQLRQVLGCEEDVNVLVINDEVCLEYDFEENRPVVAVHPFFTKVMKAHQYEGVKFMWDACFESLEMIENGDPGGGCILAHCMGLGKTLQVLALLHTVLTHPRVGMQRVLVCCPLSTVLNWVDEIHKWIGPVTDQIKVFELSKLKKTYERAYQLEDWYNGGGIFIIGYELFRSLSTLDPLLDDVRPTIINKIRTALLDPGPDIVVCDEGHLLKNDCSVLAVAMSRVTTQRRIMLTGTPIQNNLREYYCMVNFVKPNLLGTYSEYSNRFENPIMNGQHRDSREEDIKLMKARTHILHKVLEGCLQRQEASVLYPYLPKKREYTVFISLTKCQSDMYKHYLDDETGQKNKNRVLRDFHMLQKIWTHPQVLHNFMMKPKYSDENKVKSEKLEDDLAHEDLTAHEDVKDIKDIKNAATRAWWLQYLEDGEMLENLHSSNKMEAVFKILDECNKIDDKVLIFSTSLYTMDTIEYFLKKIKDWSLGQEYYRLDGSVPVEVRQKWCREFNAENNNRTRLFLISTRAGCLGLNMVAANRVIIMDTSWNPAHDIQSIFRVYRFGQKKDCYIYRLVALGTMEQKIYERAVTKQAVSCRVVDEQQIDRHYNSADLTELYNFDEHGVSVAAGVAAGVRDVVLLRVALAAAVHAVHEHDSLLRGSQFEQALDETERAAAWSQFQEEHANKQMQNGIASSLSIHVLSNDITSNTLPASYSQLFEPTPEPPLQPAKNKGHGKKSTKLTEIKPEEHTNLLQFNILVGKIMNILITQKFHEAARKKISDIVELVRGVVNLNKLTQVSKDLDSVATAVASALFQNIQVYNKPMQPLTDIERPSVEKKTQIQPKDNRAAQRSRTLKNKPGRKQKRKLLPEPEQSVEEIEELPEIKHETRSSYAQKYKRESKSIDENAQQIWDEINSDQILPDTEVEVSTSLTDEDEPLINRIKKTYPPRYRITNRPPTPSNEITDRPPTPSNEIIDRPPTPSNEITDRPPTPSNEIIDRPPTPSNEITDRPPTPSNEIIDRPATASNGIIEMEEMAVQECELTDTASETSSDSDIGIEDGNWSDGDWSGIETENLSDNGDTVLIDGQEPSNKKIKIKKKLGRPKKNRPGRKKDPNYVRKKYYYPNGPLNLPKPPKPPKPKINFKSPRLKAIYKNRPQPDFTEPKVLKHEFLIRDTAKKAQQTPVETSKPDDKQTEDDASPLIPLHPSLLRNENFIKIIAHTYLTGNPSLDEDAATLAARYSTLKALKEIESTGKDLCSGPIYDIALKVLGKPVLLKLQEGDKGKVPLTASEPIQPKKTNPQIEPKRPRPGPLSKKRIYEKSIEQSSPASTSTKGATNTSNVVPIKLTRSDTNTTSHAGGDEFESILPDDDDVTEVIEPPKLVPQHNTKPNQLLVRNVSSGDTPKSIKVMSRTKFKVAEPIPSLKVKGTNVLCGVKPTTATPSTSKQPLRPVPQESILSDTICLDSDDDEPTPSLPALQPIAASTGNQGPVPISLMAANPAALAAIPNSSGLAFGRPTLVNSQPHLTPLPPHLTPLQPHLTPLQPHLTPLQPHLTPLQPHLTPLQPNSLTALQQLTGSHQTPLPLDLNALGLLPQNIIHRSAIPVSRAQMEQLQKSGKRLIMIPPGKRNASNQPVAHSSGNIPLNASNNANSMSKPIEIDNDDVEIIQDEPVSANLKAPLSTPAPAKPSPRPGIPPANSQAEPCKMKTVCKPGDILRITKDGGVEVISRNEDIPGGDVETIDDPIPAVRNSTKPTPGPTKPTPKPTKSTPAPTKSTPAPTKSTPAPTKSTPVPTNSTPALIKPTPAPMKSTPGPVKPQLMSSRKETSIAAKETPQPSKPFSATEPNPKPQSKTIKKSTITSEDKSSRAKINSAISLQNSSSDDSRPSSPEDPMSIFRDVVRIEAAYETPCKVNTTKTTTQPLKSAFDLLKEIKNKNITVGKPQNKSTPATATTTSRVKETPAKNALGSSGSKLVGNSRTITISGSGKAQSNAFPSVDLTGKPSIQVTKVQKLSPMTAAKPGPSAPKISDSKKRPHGVTTVDIFPPKKTKKLLTLKDFNIDDFDDIIELE